LPGLASADESDPRRVLRVCRNEENGAMEAYEQQHDDLGFLHEPRRIV
jgi:hypothetical protein